MFKGEQTCSSCKRKAYYRIDDKPFCGYHSKKEERIALKPNPNIAKEKQKQIALYLELARTARTPGEPGKLIVRRSKMFGSVPIEKGYYTILPNRKAGNEGISTKTLINCIPSLSPMTLGPVKHKQEGLPDAKNLENFHQFNKCFSCEVDENGQPLEIWFTRQISGYQDEEPHRHKLGKTKAEHMKIAGMTKGDNANHCLFSLFKRPDGKLKKYSYIQSRVFYCTFYERLARTQESFLKLVDMLYEKGCNLLIAGFDARIVESDCSDDDIQKWYEDDKMPFGHEMVLYTMLKLYKTPKEYPWRKVDLGFKL